MIADEPRRRRRLSEDEHTLWRDVTRSIAPLKRRRAASAPDVAPPSEVPGKLTKKFDKPFRVDAPAQRKAPPKSSPPPLAPIDRRTRLRIARGAEAIEARLDLHGRTQSEAHGALLRFLRRAQADGARTVLVITGKGSRKSERDISREHGVLRRQVPHWLALPEFRVFVLGVEDAHVSHGGEGALYVRVRRAR
jgi:DNA-nicking Smr family endonuclease